MLLSDRIEKFIAWLEEMTDFGEWDESVKRAVQMKLIEIMTEKE